MPDAPISDAELEDDDAKALAGAIPEVEDLFSEEHLTKIIKDYMPLVRHAVNRISVGSANGGILQYEDMVSCGVQGLIEAWYAFDPNKGAKFSTYALPRIRGSILDAIRATHPLPRSLQKFGSDLEKATSALHVTLNRAPTRQAIDRHAAEQLAGVGLRDVGDHGHLAFGNQPEHLRVKVGLRIEVAVHAACGHACPCGDQSDLGILPPAQRHGIPCGVQNARLGFNELIEANRSNDHYEPQFMNTGSLFILGRIRTPVKGRRLHGDGYRGRRGYPGAAATRSQKATRGARSMIKGNGMRGVVGPAADTRASR